jgi:ABC-2 type transport system permease protein
MLLSAVVSYIRLTWDIKKLVLATAMSYRASFWAQVLGMVFNDSSWMVLWYIFFKSFPKINGWSFEQMVILFALSCLASFWCEFFCGGVAELSNYVITGQLDVYLTGPKNVLWSVSVSTSDIAALGDGLFGFIMVMSVFGHAPFKVLLVCIIALGVAVLFYDFMLIIQSLSFWLGDIQDAARRIVHMLVSFTGYPQSVFQGVLKFIMMTILPAFFVITVPVNLITDFSWTYMSIFVTSVVVGTVGSVLFFNSGLKRYESGNLMTTRQ